MIGNTYKRKAGGTFKVVATDGTNWILQREDEFEAPVAVPIEQLRREFVKATDASDVPAQHPDEAETKAAWNRLTAENKLATLAAALELGEIQPGDEITAPAVSGRQVPVGQLTDDPKELGKLRRYAQRLSGRKDPSPEDVFAKDAEKEIAAAADKIWNSGGPDGLLVRFETGALEVAPAIAAVLDRRIQQRNAIEDRQTYGFGHGIVR